MTDTSKPFRVAFLVRFEHEEIVTGGSVRPSGKYTNYRLVVSDVNKVPTLEVGTPDQLGDPSWKLAPLTEQNLRVLSVILMRMSDELIGWGKRVHEFTQTAWYEFWNQAVVNAAPIARRKPPLTAPADMNVLPAGWTRRDDLLIIDLGTIPLAVTP